MAGLSTDARGEWQRDAEKLAKLRESLEPKLEKLRAQGEHAGQRMRQQAEKIRAEIAEIVERVSDRPRH
jgi:F0F1-type ATP synthase membrane subunit b/b'